MFFPFLQVLGGLTWALNAPDTPSSGKSNGTRSAKQSSESIGRVSRSTETSQPAMKNGLVRLYNPSRSQTKPGEFVERFKEDTIHDALTAQEPPKGRPIVLISSAEGSPAKTSQLPENEPDSRANAPACSTKPSESLTLFSTPEDGFSLRMYPDSFPQTVGEISESFSRRWPTAGFTTSPGECWTADTSESHSEGGAFSSLPDALVADAPPRFYLSQRGAAGILRRANKRGKTLPAELETALLSASQQAKSDLIQKPKTSSLVTPSPHDTTPAQTERGGEPQSFLVRRLTPTECERLQGFPDGWTIP